MEAKAILVLVQAFIKIADLISYQIICIQLEEFSTIGHFIQIQSEPPVFIEPVLP